MSHFAKQLFLVGVVLPVVALSSGGCIDISTTCPDGRKVLGDACGKDASETAQRCRVSRRDCLTSDGAGNCTSSTPVNFDGISCGTSATDACNKFCINAGLLLRPYTTPCTATPLGAVSGVDVAYCNKQPSAGNYQVSCQIQGRRCNVMGTSGCLDLASTVTTGNFNGCEAGYSGPGHAICSGLPDDSGTALVGLGGSRVLSASMTKVNSCTATTGALTAMDMVYKMPSGTSVPVSVGGQNLTLKTSGGKMIVTYRCDTNGEFCNPFEIKDFWLGLQNTTISGHSITDVAFTQIGKNAFKTDKTISATGPGFRVVAKYDGISAVTYTKTAMPIKYTGGLNSAPFTLAGTFDLPIRWGNPQTIAKAHVTLNLAGSTFSGAGTGGGYQVNCGNNGAQGSFMADTDFLGGAGKTRLNVIDLGGVINPAPMEVYQSQHYASPFSYIRAGFAPGSSHLIRLHFAETNPVNNAAGKRKFSVAINFTTMISNLDLFATVGMNHAYVREFTVSADSSGKYVFNFTASVDSATISGIEIL